MSIYFYLKIILHSVVVRTSHISRSVGFSSCLSIDNEWLLLFRRVLAVRPVCRAETLGRTGRRWIRMPFEKPYNNFTVVHGLLALQLFSAGWRKLAKTIMWVTTSKIYCRNRQYVNNPMLMQIRVRVVIYIHIYIRLYVFILRISTIYFLLAVDLTRIFRY